MVVIADARLLERRLETLRTRREELKAAEGARAPIAGWAADALLALGMTRAEIAAADAEAAAAPAPPERERELADTDSAIDALEEELLTASDGSPGALHALAEIALARLRRSVATDPGDVFYDVGEVRALHLFEHVVDGLARLRDTDLRRTG